MAGAEPDTRRRERHAETREAILAHSVQIMARDGVAGLTLGEVARRLGVRTPSLYTYFPSKSALFDELFASGWSAALASLTDELAEAGPVGEGTDLVTRGIRVGRAVVVWHLKHPAVSQLMLLRPVPAWEPRPTAFEASRRYFDVFTAEVDSWRSNGLIRPDVDTREATENIASITTGVVVRQLANQPGVEFEDGRASRHHPALLGALIKSWLPKEAEHGNHPTGD